MRVLTVRQPWAWAIVHGGKDVENRTRNIAGAYRGPVAIHAGLGAFVKGTPAGEAHAAVHGSEVPTTLHFGAVIGVVDLVDVHHGLNNEVAAVRAVRSCFQPGKPYGPCSLWAMADHHHLVLANPRPLATPVPARGRLGLWRPDDTLSAVIDQQLALDGTEPLAVAPPATSPDCRAQKCRACSGDAWDDERDVLVPCAHDCHGGAS